MPGEVPNPEGLGVAPAELPPGYLTTRVTPDDMGAGAAAGVSNAGRALESIAMKQKASQDEVATLRADTALGEWQQSTLYDPQSGLLTKQGKDAIDAAPDALDAFDKQQQAIADSLTNDTQRRAFLQAATTRRLQYNHVISRHVKAASMQLDDETTHSSLALSKQNAATNYGDPAVVNLELERQKQAIIGYAQRNGKPAAWVEDQIAQNAGATHASIVEEHIGANDTAGAQAYLEAHKDELSSSDRVQLENKLKVADTANQAQAIADSLVMDPKGAVRSRADIDADIQKDGDLAKNTHLRDQVQSRVDQFLEHKHQAEDESQRNTFRQAAQMVQDPDNHLGIFDPHVQQMRLGMTPEQWQTVEAYSSARDKNQPIATDWKVYNDLSARLTSPDQSIASAALAEDIPGKFGGKLAGAQTKELIDLQNAKRRELTTGVTDEKLASASLVRQIGSDALLAHGYAGKVDEALPGSPDSPNPANVFTIQFQTALRRAVDARQALDPKAKITPEIVQQEADKLLIKHATGQQSRGFWGGIASFVPFTFDVRTGDAEARYPFQDPKFATTPLSPKELSDTDRQTVTDRFRERRGRDPKPEELMAAYFRWKASDATP